MGQATPHRPLALVVEDDADQRFIASTLIEELGMNVIQCESAEAAKLVMDKCGTALSLLFTDINLAGA
jgi:CheY-like chemotaxis protein